VLLVQPSLQPPGGGNGVAAWILQALVTDYQVTVLSWEPVDTFAINRFFGTNVHGGQFDTIVVPALWRWLADRLPVPAALLKSALLMRYARRVSESFDIVVGAHNEIDFGRRGIQFVNYPTYLRPRPPVDFRWYHRSNLLLNFYYRFADWVAGFSLERMKRNVTLANSDWTAAHVKRVLGIDARTVYPPAADPAPRPAWAERRTAFVALGRISPEKEYERAMRILARVRQRVPELTFTIIGTSDKYARRYARQLQRLGGELGTWISFRENLSREEVRAALAEHRYGIHAMREEHFGMSPAEMVRAGMIVWVPSGGGQMEIVGQEPALLYSTEEEAASKILHVIQSGIEQERLTAYLESRAPLFGSERFMNDIRSIVAAFDR